MKAIENIIKLGDIKKGDIISIVGSGGKTALAKGLARHLSRKYQVAMLTTTKITCPESDEYDELAIDFINPLKNLTGRGIFYFAKEYLEDNKIAGFSQEIFDYVKTNMDIVIIEADGSKRLPLKGWGDHEPVVIPETTLTIGVIPVSQIGQRISKRNVHRLDRFLELTKSQEGDIIEVSHYMDIINHEQGLFKGACGRKGLFISQANNEERKILAETICEFGNFGVNFTEIGHI